MELRLHVRDLTLGLFVTELDRPWLDTPFLLQGFLIETQQQLDTLADYCQSVTIDTARSLGGAEQWAHLGSAGGTSPHTPGNKAIIQLPQQTDEQKQVERREKLGLLQELRRLFGLWRGRGAAQSFSSHAQQQQAGQDIILYESSVTASEEMPRATEVQKQTQVTLENFVNDLRAERIPNSQSVHEAVDAMVESVVRNPDALLWLSQLRQRDHYSYSHSVDTAVYLLTFARHLGFTRNELRHFGFAGLMLDIGKLRLPESVLQREGRYSPGEFLLMQTHVRHGLDILEELPEIHPDILEIVARHHERYDGSGYPARLKGEDIGLPGAMASIVDCFSALISERQHEQCKSVYEALQLLYKWSERYFHPTLVEQFAQCIGIFPVGSLVELSCGDVGIVISHSRTRRLKPKLLLLLGPDKQPYARPMMMDLMVNPSASDDDVPIHIRRELPHGSYNINPADYFQV